MFFLTNRHVCLAKMDLQNGNGAAGSPMKMFFLTKIKVFFDQYHQQMDNFHLSWTCMFMVDIQKGFF